MDTKKTKRNGLIGLLSIAMAFLNTPTYIYAQAEIKDVADLVQFTPAELSVKAIRLVDDTSQVLRFERPVIRTAVGNPVIMDVVAINQHEIMLVANEIGSTSLVVWEAGGINQAYQVFVDHDPHVLEETIKSAYPDSAVTVHSLGDKFALTGEIGSLEEREKMMTIAEGYKAGSVDALKIKEPKQVLIDVFFVEIDRTNSFDYGYSWHDVGKYLNLASTAGQVQGLEFSDEVTLSATGGQFETSSYNLNDAATFIGNYWDGQTNITSQLELLQSKNVLHILAKPKLLAKDGEEAEFLVGGQFPYATASANGTNVEFRNFGHQLKFTPFVLDDKRIRLTVKSVVSELNFASTVTISGSTVPSITENSASTVVELGNHQTLVIGGFLSKRKSDTSTKVPLLGDIPGIGKLFKSNDDEGREHELMFIITPHIVEPMTLEGAEKAGKEFYEKEDIERVDRIDELPDDEFKWDAVDSVLRNYDSNRLLSDASLDSLDQDQDSLAKDAESGESNVSPEEEASAVKETAANAATAGLGAEVLAETPVENTAEKTDDTAAPSAGGFVENQLINNIQPSETMPIALKETPVIAPVAMDSVAPSTPVVAGAAMDMSKVSSSMITTAPIAPIAAALVNNAPVNVLPVIEEDAGLQATSRFYKYISPAAPRKSNAIPAVAVPEDKASFDAGMKNEMEKQAMAQTESMIPPAERTAADPSALLLNQPVVKSAGFEMGASSVSLPIVTTSTPVMPEGNMIGESMPAVSVPRPAEAVPAPAPIVNDYPSYDEKFLKPLAHYDPASYQESIRLTQSKSRFTESGANRTMFPKALSGYDDRLYRESILKSQNRNQAYDRRAYDEAITRSQIKSQMRDSDLYNEAIARSQARSKVRENAVRFYRAIASRVGMKRVEMPEREPETMQGSAAGDYRAGYRNFRLSESSWGPTEWVNYRREQERLDQFFSGDILPKRG